MAQGKVNISKVKKRILAIVLMSVLLGLIFSLKTSPGLVERYYSRGLYTFVRGGFQFLFNYMTFSVGDILYIVIIALLIWGVYKFYRTLMARHFEDTLQLFLGFILKIQVAVGLFYLLWALNYFREPAHDRLNLPSFEYSSDQLIAVTEMLIDSANQSRAILRASDFKVTQNQIVKPAVQAIIELSRFNPPLLAIKPTAKGSLLSPILNYLGTAGYYNPFTGEAQFNNLMPPFTQPFVACHEMAHQMGIGAEDEANFTGFIAGKSSNNSLLKYSAYYLASQEFMNEVWRTDSLAFRQMKAKISPQVRIDLETERAYWTKYQGGAARLSSIFYDNYLKANKQPEGLKTYNRMIKLSMAYYKEKGIIK